jgi:hypothetical protein
VTSPWDLWSSLTLFDGGIGDGRTVTGVAVILDLARDLHAVRLQLRQDIVAEVQGQGLPAGPAIVL